MKCDTGEEVPHYQLINEFKKETKQWIHIVNYEEFLNLVDNLLKIETNKEIKYKTPQETIQDILDSKYSDNAIYTSILSELGDLESLMYLYKFKNENLSFEKLSELEKNVKKIVYNLLNIQLPFKNNNKLFITTLIEIKEYANEIPIYYNEILKNIRLCEKITRQHRNMESHHIFPNNDFLIDSLYENIKTMNIFSDNEK